MMTENPKFNPNVDETWRAPLNAALEEHGQPLKDFLSMEKSRGKTVYPPAKEVFQALRLTPLNKVKVVIIGQDPYHGPNQAHGLSFSVKKGCNIPPSLQNIHKELQDDLGFQPPDHGCLTHWAEQGVLLLNSSLTVESGRAASHRNKGWEQITDHLIEAVSNSGEPCVFILWGRHAAEKAVLIDKTKNLVITSSHPSPMGGACYRGFFGSKPFSRANNWLIAHHREPVDWNLCEEDNTSKDHPTEGS